MVKEKTLPQILALPRVRHLFEQRSSGVFDGDDLLSIDMREDGVPPMAQALRAKQQSLKRYTQAQRSASMAH